MGCVLGRESPKEAETGGLVVAGTEPSLDSIIAPLKGADYFLKSLPGKSKPVGAAARARRGSVSLFNPHRDHSLSCVLRSDRVFGGALLDMRFYP